VIVGWWRDVNVCKHARTLDEVGVSVLVPTLDRPEDLNACLTSLLANTYPSFEVIVIDQSPEPYKGITDSRLRIIAEVQRGKSRALNVGMSFASGRYFAFTDDDCTVPADWLARGVALMDSRPDVDLVYGALNAMPHDSAEVFVPGFTPQLMQEISGASRARIRGGAGANMFARRELFAKIGPFDTIIGPGALFPSCEEYDIYYRALRAGRKVLRDPDNGVLHWGARPYADGSGQRLKRNYRYGEGAVLAKHVRAGDLAAVRVSTAILGEYVSEAAYNFRHGRRTGFGLLAYWLAGFGRGLLTPVDAKRRLFS
jgi:glycosyltransferase involved in cell wall biosynthesis